MKGIKLFSAIVAFTLFSTVSFAQEVAHVNLTELVNLMPETKAAEAEIKKILEGHEAEIKTQEAALQKEGQAFQEKYKDLNVNTATKAQIEQAQAEQKLLQEKIQRLDEYRTTAAEEVQQTRQRLITPIDKKVTDAINAAAAKKGVKYVLDSSPNGIVLYYNGGYNLNEDVKKELGL